MKKATKKVSKKKSKLPPRVNKEDPKRIKALDKAFIALNKMQTIHVKIKYDFLTSKERRSISKIQDDMRKAYLVLATKK